MGGVSRRALFKFVFALPTAKRDHLILIFGAKNQADRLPTDGALYIDWHTSSDRRYDGKGENKD